MTDLDIYLAQHFLSAEQCAQACDLSTAELDALVRAQLVPAPSYVVTPDGMLQSYGFGAMAAPGSAAGQFFHPSQSAWVALAQSAIEQHGREHAGAAVQAQFIDRFYAALAELNISTWRMPDSFADDGSRLADGLRKRSDIVWEHFLGGTFGVCVAKPVSEADIAWKEVLQEKLTTLSDNGKRSAYAADQLESMRALIAAFAASAMPFSPIEYHLCSRKRLADDLLPRLSSL